MASATSGPGSGLPPRPPGPRCASCFHQDRERLDAALVSGDRTYASLAEEFGIPASSIHRHANEHLPVRLLRAGAPAAALADEGLVALAITASASRLRRIQARSIQLEEIRVARAAAADPAVPGAHTGLLVTKVRSIRTGPASWERLVEAELDTGLLAEERALEAAAALETGEWLAQHGRGTFGSDGSGGRGPLVVVLASGLQPLPGPEPGVARHRIQDPKRLRSATAAEAEAAAAALPLHLMDLEVPAAAPVTSEEAFSGAPPASGLGPEVARPGADLEPGLEALEADTSSFSS